MDSDAKILMSCARLHNFIIDNDGIGDDDNNDEDDVDVDGLDAHFGVFQQAPMNMVYLPILPNEPFNAGEIGLSYTRLTIVDVILEM